MGQKAFPTSLRFNNYSKIFSPNSFAYWNEANINYITSLVKKLLKDCCESSDMYLDKTEISKFNEYLQINIVLIHFHSKSTKPFFSRRYKENKRQPSKNSWPQLIYKLNAITKFLQRHTGAKEVKLCIKHFLVFSRTIPKESLKKMGFYVKPYNRKRYAYAKNGLQLLNLAIQNKLNSYSLQSFFEKNLLSKTRKHRINSFLKYVKHAFASLISTRKTNGLKIQVKGRFARKAKARSKTWKYKIGKVPFARLIAPVNAYYGTTNTAYGSVGFKIWLF